MNGTILNAVSFTPVVLQLAYYFVCEGNTIHCPNQQIKANQRQTGVKLTAN